MIAVEDTWHRALLDTHPATRASVRPAGSRHFSRARPLRLRLPPGQQHSPGWEVQPHDFPAQARRPSMTAHPAMASATALSSRQAPNKVLASSPANTARAR